MKYSDAKIENLLSLLNANGGNISAACEAVGISRKTFYEWKKSDEAFADAYEEVREKVGDNVETALYTAALGGNVVGQIFLLKTRYADRGYVERFEHHGSAGRPPVQVAHSINFENLSTDELRTYFEILKKATVPNE